MGLALAAGLTAIIVVEALVASRREFFVEGPAEQIQLEAGDPSLPPIDLVVLGDSTSVGVGTTPEDSYPVVLTKRLSDSYRIRLKVFGESGARTADVADTQVAKALKAKPDVVLVCIGANDSTHLTRIKDVSSKMGQALDELVSSGATVVVAGPPDMGTTRAFAQPLRWLSGMNGRRVAKAIRHEASIRGLTFIPLAERTGPAFDADPTKHYSSDLFHPGANGYRLWADAMYPEMAATLAKRSR